MRCSEFHYILHADLDAFYASVEEMDDPSLQGKPVVVGGPPESRGVVAAASYAARQYGVRSATPMGTALRLCPNLIRVSPRFDRYRQVSAQVMAIFKETTKTIEPLSLDEAYLDIGTQPSMDRVAQIARAIKFRVKDDTMLAITIGGGSSKTVAKVASQVAKPDGLMVIVPGGEREFLAPLGVEILSGIGPKTEKLLKGRGVTKLGDLARTDEAWLVKVLGKRGRGLKERALGVDASAVEPFRETKSVTAETTMARDVEDEQLLISELKRLAEGVSAKLRGSHLMGKTVTIRLRLSDFTTFTRQRTLSAAINGDQEIFFIAYELLMGELIPGRKFRLIGVGITNFTRVQQLSLLAYMS